MNEISQTTSYTPAIAFDCDLLKEQVPNLSIAPESKATLVPSAEREHHLFVRKTSQRYGHTYVGQEHNFIYWLLRAEKLVDAIARSDDQPIEVTHDRRGQPWYQLTKIGKAFFNVCKGYMLART